MISERTGSLKLYAKKFGSIIRHPVSESFVGLATMVGPLFFSPRQLNYTGDPRVDILIVGSYLFGGYSLMLHSAYRLREKI